MKGEPMPIVFLDLGDPVGEPVGEPVGDRVVVHVQVAVAIVVDRDGADPQPCMRRLGERKEARS